MSTGVKGNVLHFSKLFSYPKLLMLFCLIISFPRVSLVFAEVRKGTWFGFLAFSKMRGEREGN